jgi:hypothetical protein
MSLFEGLRGRLVKGGERSAMSEGEGGRERGSGTGAERLERLRAWRMARPRG